MTVNVITTLHKDGYDLYGSSNLKTWSKFFPQDWNITYYAEKHNPVLPPNFKILDFDQVCPEWQSFYRAVKNSLSDSKDKKIINRHKKALRWSFKMFSLLHSLSNTNQDYLIWLDSDIIATKPCPDRWIEKNLGKKCIAGQLERLKVGSHIETGALIFDINHKDIIKIKEWIQLGYYENKILEQDKPWDGIWMAKLLMQGNVSWNNVKIVNQKVQGDKWLMHDVGKIKFKNIDFNNKSGRSPDTELI